MEGWGEGWGGGVGEEEDGGRVGGGGGGDEGGGEGEGGSEGECGRGVGGEVEGVAVLLWCEFGSEGWGESGEGGGRGVELFFVRGCSEDGVEGGNYLERRHIS